jgi:hypothetical protein
VPALCQALCILLSGALGAQSFFQLVSRSALLAKVVDCVKILAGEWANGTWCYSFHPLVCKVCKVPTLLP